jgi:hypothetical protein
MIFSVENASYRRMSRSLAPALSLTDAAVTTRASSQPSVSTARCRPRPVIFLPPWYPLVFLLTVSWALIICESMMQAVGCAARPWYWRSSSRSRVMSARGRPRPFHRSKNAYAASHGGRSTGRARHSTPFLTTYATASHIARRSCTIGRPAAMVSSRITSRARGSSTSHWASVRSEG